MADKAVVTQTTLDLIGQAIIAKGGATAPMTPAQMKDAILAIPSGEEPDIAKTLEEDTDTRESKAIILLTNAPESSAFSGASAYRFSDAPDEIVTSGSHVWNRQRDINGKFRWVMLYGATISFVFNTNLEILKIRVKDGGVYNLIRRSFINCYNLSWISGGELTLTSVDGCFSGANGIRGLESKMIVEDASLTSATGMFTNAVSLQFLPQRSHFVNGTSLSFTSCKLIDRDSFAVIANGVVTGGFIHGLDAVTSGTLTMNEELKNKFDETTERQIVADALSAKGWTLAW